MGRGTSKVGGARKAGGARRSNRAPSNEGEVHGSDANGYMTDKGIAELENLGFNRWQNYGRDRLYITRDAVSKIAGLELDYYKTGNISSATLDGEKISNNRAGNVLVEMTKAYIDVPTMKVVGMPGRGSNSEFLGVAQKVEGEIRKRIYEKK